MIWTEFGNFTGDIVWYSHQKVLDLWIFCFFLQPTCWGYDWTESSTNCTIHEKSTYDQHNEQNGTVHVEIGETCKKSMFMTNEIRIFFRSWFFFHFWRSLIILHYLVQADYKFSGSKQSCQLFNTWSSNSNIILKPTSDKRAVYLGCFKQEPFYMAVKAGTVEGSQYMYTQVNPLETAKHLMIQSHWPSLTQRPIPTPWRYYRQRVSMSVNTPYSFIQAISFSVSLSDSVSVSQNIP